MLRSFFIGLSTNKAFRAFSERSSIGRRVSRRFVAGMSIDEAIAAAAQLNAEGIDVTLDSLGESVLDVAHAEASAAIYHQLLDAIEARKLRANVSVKLTQVGMDIGGPTEGPALAERIVGEMVAHAAHIGSFVRIDMEGSEYTEPTLLLTERLHQQYPGAVGTVLQAYLFRTENDVERLISQGIRIRLCKGAYKEPRRDRLPRQGRCRRQLHQADEARRLEPGLLRHRHPRRSHREPAPRVSSRSTASTSSAFEFQMLYGIRRDLQRKLVAEGFGVRVYVPFGAEWYPYFMRRLAERPANVLFLAKNFFKS